MSKIEKLIQKILNGQSISLKKLKNFLEDLTIFFEKMDMSKIISIKRRPELLPYQLEDLKEVLKDLATKKNLNYYLNLNWTYTIERETHQGQSYYIIHVNELPGACTDALTVEEGMKEIQDVIQATIELHLKNGEEIPEPINKEKFKGQIAYRTTSERHYHLARLARQQHKSLSKTIDIIIDTGLQNFKSRLL